MTDTPRSPNLPPIHIGRPSKHPHPFESVPVRYCRCGNAIVQFGEGWFHVV